MSSQLELFPGGPNLTDRQRFALSLVEDHAGTTADFVGLAWHARRGKHDGHRKCEWCATDGQAVLVELRRKGLVVRRRSGRWLSTRKPTPEAERDNQQAVGQSNVIPF